VIGLFTKLTARLAKRTIPRSTIGESRSG